MVRALGAHGQSRCFDPLPATSNLPRTTDIIRLTRLVRFVPASTFWGKKSSKRHTDFGVKTWYCCRRSGSVTPFEDGQTVTCIWTAEVHCGDRRRGYDMVARGARAAAGSGSDHWALTPGASGWCTEIAAFAEATESGSGWIEGRTIAIEYRWSEGRPERIVEIAAEFARQKIERHCDMWRRRRYFKTGDNFHSHRLCNRG